MCDRLTGLLAGIALALVALNPREPQPPEASGPPPTPREVRAPVEAGPRRPGPSPRSPSAWIGGPRHPDGTEIDCDLPGALHQKNTGGSDGAGLCVFASMRHSGRWQGDPVFEGLFDWMKARPGGGYPEKVSRMVEEFAREKGYPVPDYLQVESTDLEILREACRAGRLPGVTYCSSPTGRYSGQRIAHMVSLVAAGDRHFTVLDNNYPGPEQYEWMSPDEFARAYTGGKSGWSVILLSPGPPPPPRSP